MFMLALVLVAMVALAAFCAIRLTRIAAPKPAPLADVAPMKVALERRIREGADFRL